MNVRLVRIGNSRGLRLPKAVIEQCGFEDEVDLTVDERTVIVRARRQPREGWAKQFAATKVPTPILVDVPNAFDEREWTW